MKMKNETFLADDIVVYIEFPEELEKKKNPEINKGI